MANFTATVSCIPSFANPVFTGQIGAGLSTKAGGQPFDQTLNVYGNIYFADSFTNGGGKDWTIFGAPYYSVHPGGEPDIAYLHGQSGSGGDALFLGGGITGADAAQTIQFYTSPTYSTPVGSLRMTVDSNGGLYMAGATGGSQGAGTINATAVYANGVALTSDARLKTNITAVTNDESLKYISGLKPVRFRWSDSKMGRGDNIGFLAQQVREELPQLVRTGNDPRHLLSLNYEGFIPLLVGAVQELDRRTSRGPAQTESEKVKMLEAALVAQESELAAMHRELVTLKHQVELKTAQR